MLTLQDKEFLASKGITEEQVAAQLKDLERGFPFLKLAGAAEAGKGIVVCDDAAVNGYLDTWKDYKKSNSGKIFKFVPASGAASRMFKNLFEFVDAEYDEPTSDFEKKFFAEIKKFAFYDALDKACKKTKGKNIDELVAEGSYKAVVSTLLDKDGLNYGQLPKGLLLFHSYDDGSRTPLEEHLVEGALYAADGAGNVNVHFTVSPEHRAMFEKLVAEKVKKYEDKFGVKYNVSFSEQKSSTDTVAGTMDNQPFRTGDGKILFRPGGHGALIENLNDLDADVVFIKNIDNLVPDCLKDETVKYKMVLAGLLVSLQKRAFAYLEKLDSGNYAHADLEEIIRFVQQDLCCRNPKIKELEDADLVIYLKGKLNRPIRVCGMVKNIGEPGGGPFLVYNADGTISLQILESSQIDKNNKESMEMFTKGTHFNPVDLVCSLKNYKGEKFNLSEYVDKSTGFISYKSTHGKDLKALELPGLWNGAMSNWNTVFVEVPLITFNPVKTVNDLLREQHQK